MPQPQSPNEHDELTRQVYFQGKGMPWQKFPAKFLFAVDTRFQIWLNKCKPEANCNKVYNSIIDFRPLVNEVNFGSFHMDLPPTSSMKFLRKEERKRKWQGLFASEEQFPPQKNLHAHKQIVGLKLCRQAIHPMPPMEQQVQVLPLLVSPEILFQLLHQQVKPHQKQRSHGNRSTKNVGVHQGVCNWWFGLESSNVQPSKKTPNIDNPITTKPNPNLLDGLPHHIHHQSTSQNTPVLRPNKLSVQTPQPKQPDTVKLRSMAGLTCLGEYLLLELIVFLS